MRGRSTPTTRKWDYVTGTELNGVLAPDGNHIVLTFTVPVAENSSNTLKFIIADSGDQAGEPDSTAYIANLHGIWVDPGGQGMNSLAAEPASGGTAPQLAANDVQQVASLDADATANGPLQDRCIVSRAVASAAADAAGGGRLLAERPCPNDGKRNGPRRLRRRVSPRHHLRRRVRQRPGNGRAELGGRGWARTTARLLRRRSIPCWGTSASRAISWTITGFTSMDDPQAWSLLATARLLEAASHELVARVWRNRNPV